MPRFLSYKSVLCVVFLITAVSLSSCFRGEKPVGKVDYTSDKINVVTSEKNLAGSCAPGTVLIPAGPMIYGPNEERGRRSDGKEERINIKAFCIDKFEYPNELGEHPKRNVTWMDAKKLCADRGKRLCTEYEWEKACRGPAASLYTYGDGYAKGYCPGASDDYTLGQYSNCVSGFGVHEMSGGVYEWTSSPAGGTSGDDLKILRGGMSADQAAASSRCTFRLRQSDSGTSSDMGFRCCSSTTKEDAK